MTTILVADKVYVNPNYFNQTEFRDKILPDIIRTGTMILKRTYFEEEKKRKDKEVKEKVEREKFIAEQKAKGLNSYIDTNGQEHWISFDDEIDEIEKINRKNWKIQFHKSPETWYSIPEHGIEHIRFSKHIIPEESKRSYKYGSRYIPSDVKKAVWERDGGRCVECGSTHRLHYDHEIPFSKGGSNTEKNIRILCKKCNLRKSDKIE